MNRTHHKVVTTDEQIGAALARAQQFESEDIRVRRASYDRKGDQVCLLLTNGVSISIPRKQLQGLENVSSSQASKIEVLGRGTGLYWPQLDVSHYVPGLLNGVFGTRQWMVHLGRLGGASRSKVKAAAARINGQKGGRPSSRRRTA